MDTLTGKLVLVTGASKGIGRAIAIGLAGAGCDLVLAARTMDLGEDPDEPEKSLIETAKQVEAGGRRALVVQMDLGDDEAVSKLVQRAEEEFGHLDVLVNVAFGHIGEDEDLTLLDVSPEEIREFVNSGVSGTMILTRACVPLLKKSEGCIVNIVADWGLPMHNVLTGSAVYVGAKYAIMGFTTALGRELGIPVSAICPCITASEFGIDSPVDRIIESYDGWAIAVQEIVDAVKFILMRRTSIVKQIVFGPLATTYDGLLPEGLPKELE